ncbi:MAG TPA: hypothetical protein VN841_03655 [Bryobacteraceae bacterium]|nr:hypothetical protein [Bryobacteraceae bacterium]
MRVELKPETERLVQEELRSGHVQTVDELIVHGVQALREKSKAAKAATAPPRKPRKNLADFLLESPFAGSEIDLERQRDYGRPVDL